MCNLTNEECESDQEYLFSLMEENDSKVIWVRPEVNSIPVQIEFDKAVKKNEIIRDVEFPDIYIWKHLESSVSSSRQAYKKKYDRVYNNYHCCFFCGEVFLHIPVHM